MCVLQLLTLTLNSSDHHQAGSHLSVGTEPSRLRRGIPAIVAVSVVAGHRRVEAVIVPPAELVSGAISV